MRSGKFGADEKSKRGVMPPTDKLANAGSASVLPARAARWETRHSSCSTQVVRWDLPHRSQGAHMIRTIAAALAVFALTSFGALATKQLGLNTLG